MMTKKSQKSRGFNLVAAGGVFLVFTLLITSVYLIFKAKKTAVKSTGKNNKEIVTVSENPSQITYYKSQMFNYRIEYPRSLKVRELGSGGGYIDFVRFEEEEDASFKGFAIGVSEYELDTEISRIKKIFEEEGGFLSEETAIKINDLPARQLYYTTSEEGMENRVIVIFSYGPYTYSISSFPSQIEEILRRFQLSVL